MINCFDNTIIDSNFKQLDKQQGDPGDRDRTEKFLFWLHTNYNKYSNYPY